MRTIRKSDTRGNFNHGWLRTFHTFSFADYHDPAHMAFRSLRVMNEDFIRKGEGFGTHSHRNMEIVTCVLHGELAHKDSMGNGSTVKPGEFQYMSAGKGVTHSEFNFSQEAETHLYQIWIVPNQNETSPRYGQVMIKNEEKHNQLARIAGPNGSGAPIEIHQDAYLSICNLDPGKSLPFLVKSTHPYLYLQVLKGSFRVGTDLLSDGDGCAIAEEYKVTLSGENYSEFLLFELA